MSKDYIQAGEVLEHTPASDVNSDDTVIMGNIVGIALTDIASGETGSVKVTGVFSRAKTTGTAWNQGDTLDFDESTGEFAKGLTPATGDITGAAVAAKAAESADATGEVLLARIPGTIN